MDLIINNRIITTDLLTILKDLQFNLSNGKLKVVKRSGSDISVTCPCHKNGQESRPSCFINLSNEEIPYGYFHCFTCNESGPFEEFVSECMDTSIGNAKKWLVDNYGGDYLEGGIELPEIILDNQNEKEEVLDENILKTFNDNHPYFKQRKLSDDIVNKFELKYDPKTECVVFPVRDIKGKLIGLTKRKVKYKRYELPKFKNKPVYLLYNVIKENINHVVVCESQINALYLWSLGIPAIALFGTGTTYQYKLLNKSGIMSYTLCLDGDDAGRKGVKRFIENINKQCFVDGVELPDGKDINDMDPDTVIKLFKE